MSAPRVELLDFAAFEALEAGWDELVRGSDAAWPFLTHAWVRVWWRHFGQGLEFSCPIVRRDGLLLAAVPLVIREQRALGRRFRVAEIAGTGPVPTRGLGLADRADLIVRRAEDGARALLGAALVEQLERVDLVHLAGIPADSPTIEVFGRGAQRPWIVERSTSPYLPLDGDWDSYLRSRSQRFRKQLKRSLRGLGEQGVVELSRQTGAEADDRLLGELAEVDQSSWKGRRGTGLLQHPLITAFFRELLGELARQGMLELHVLRVGGSAAAYEMTFDLGGRIFAYNAGFRHELAPHSPGNVVTAEVIRSAYARGRVEYDMLRGAEPYKLRWSSLVRHEVELLLPARRARARLQALAGPYTRARLRRVAWIVELDDRLSGAWNRMRAR